MTRVIAALLCAVACLAPRAATAQAAIPPALLEGAPGDRVRILIRLAVAVQPEGALAPEAVFEQRGRIAATQSVARGLLQAAGLHIGDYTSLPYLSAEVARSQLPLIAAHSLVAAIHEDLIFKSALHESVPRIRAPQVWSAGYDGSGWTVAVLDTGVDRQHRFLAGKVVGEACFSTTSSYSTSLCPGGASSSTVAGSAAPCPSGVGGCGHGTHVAGIAVGNDTQVGVYGVAKGASLLPIQVFSRFEDAGLCSPVIAPCALTYTSDFARGLDFVMVQAGPGNANRVAAANLSVAGTNYSGACDSAPGMAPVKDAIDNLRSIGIATVIAAGNDGAEDAISSPACISSAVSVGATDDLSDAMADFSNRGPQLRLLAPGTTIYSSLPDNSWGYYAGTSMAAPHVAGAWALLKQMRPSASTTSILDALRGTGAAVGDQPAAVTYPRIDVAAAAQQLASPSQPPSPPLNVVAAVSGATVTVTWQAPASGPVTAYIVEAGSAPGASNFFNAGVGAGLSVAGQVPPGTYYIRVRAQNASGVSTVSNEVVATVSSTGGVVPGPPQNLTVSVAGSTISIAWEAPISGGTVSDYVVEAGSAPGAANLYVGTFGPGARSLSAPAPNGIYYIRVRARNGGGVSGPSNEVVATVGTPCTTPGAPVISGSKTGHMISVTWTLPAGGPVTHFVAQAGSSPGAANLYNAPVGAGPSVSASAPDGAYYIRIIAVAQCGTSVPSNEIVISIP